MRVVIIVGGSVVFVSNYILVPVFALVNGIVFPFLFIFQFHKTFSFRFLFFQFVLVVVPNHSRPKFRLIKLWQLNVSKASELIWIGSWNEAILQQLPSTDPMLMVGGDFNKPCSTCRS